MKTFARIFIAWIPLAVVIVGLSGLIHVTVQQNYRMSLNDPQIQMAQDVSAAITAGVPVSSVVPELSIDMQKSLAPFIIVYDENGKAVGYSGTLSGAVPVPPAGVFNYAKENGSDRLTWEPQRGVRIAIDVEPIAGGKGFVLAGRNMREVEDRESALEEMVSIGMIILLVATFAAKAFAETVG